MQVLVASRNKKKLAELQRVLAAANVEGIELLSLADVPEYPETPETGATFEANARIKALDGVRNAGLPTVADDSGLAVDALNGMPGVLSARWCGAHGEDAENNRLLLAQLSDVPDDRRGARFVSSCVLAVPAEIADAADLEPEVAVTGEWEGRILRAEQGTNGFGYDPLFEPAEAPGQSSAELTPERKDELSHRGKALQQLVPALRVLAQSAQ
ncbi:non-canonical purine NTP pyrophosphatase [Corynebacterium urealyticum]|uniref:dITP/XTP pyrophosphatase n=1 Tax=Corynebacterium urealyticum (strain ATCC 43042 / DSM 7109) TaxID=504474 RepID=IXTPA_CORU7|nr:non-canonical purine NTP pyrophosphatase [Corynebacterium urealyticum]B1VGW8.1 RecName: Full=dITP/XTP pyrophosphatase; AltName: Full=Non-canonical purine NTP pyrophosphatase; AltName: Full=Non-standard purine NTP pyrophosphatase; AltName: Full=Nucleoside-triphosphate diphosphatase; AltName: Full=Nucleoside-triphosphate pyrophosphatase; Short=NTPase [Corynebacterium urealyticum DSM 7109]AGE37002.1 putative xanthosine triphosphate pyrophosphatase [Corynebacterium urealyticum DSM 7111]QQB06891.1